jgi:FkbM family methyltransferase
MNLSAISSDSRIGHLLRMPLRLLPRGVVLPVNQGPLRGRKWISGASDHGCWLGSYEYRKQRLFATLVSQGDTAFDIGANVGFYTLLASVQAGPKGAVVAFEPLPRNVELLERHLRLNALDNVTVMNAAVGNRMGTVRFAPHLHSNSMGQIDENGSLEVPLVSLDGLMESGSIAVPSVVKIDVEGAEYDVLQGGAQLLARAQPVILLATHGAEVHSNCCDLLQSWGYQLSAVNDAESVAHTDEILARPRGIPIRSAN